jgi:cysteine sulfinate desulfinase/cysteine desulfurase-like protein/rhodanese-related sulfurtransferase
MHFLPGLSTLLSIPRTAQPHTMPNSLYLDSNATTHVLPAAIAAATRAMREQFGNPSSSHSHGIVAKALLEQTRATAAQVMGAGDGHVVFTSGATEGIQTAVLSALRAVGPRRVGQGGQLLVYGTTEHKAVPQALEHWNHVLGLGLELRALPVDSEGQHDLQTLAQWLPDTALLCTMAANNETGVITNLAAIEDMLLASNSKALWLVDCVQALGKMDLDLQHSRIDYAPFSGHKLYAPKGIGMLYVRRSAPFTPLMAGGGQEGGLRSGTENMPGIAALGAVLDALQQGNTFANHATLRGYRDQLEQSLRIAFPALVFNVPLAHSLPTTLNFSVPGISSKAMLDVFDAAGLRVSAGSACSAAKAAPSYVLDAMGLPAWRTTSAVRLSIGAMASAQWVDAACVAIIRCGQVLLAMHDGDEDEPSSSDATLMDAPCSAEDAAAMTLQWSELGAFLASHPKARLLDVREAAEHHASRGIRYGTLAAINVPLSSIAALPDAWLESKAAPVVVVCRSGKRSLKAAQWLRSQGYLQVRHLHGGLALRPASVSTPLAHSPGEKIAHPTAA